MLFAWLNLCEIYAPYSANIPTMEEKVVSTACISAFAYNTIQLYGCENNICVILHLSLNMQND